MVTHQRVSSCGADACAVASSCRQITYQEEAADSRTGRAEGYGGVDVEASHPLQERRRHQELVQLVGRVPKERVNGHTQDLKENKRQTYATIHQK